MSLALAISNVALWVLVIGQTVLILGLVHAVHGLQEGTDGAPMAPQAQGEGLAGQPAPPLAGTDVLGEPVDLADYAGEVTAVLFVSPTCSSCIVTLEELEGLRTKAEGNVIVVCAADTAECRVMRDAYGLAVPVVADPDEEISKRFEVTAPPAAVLISKGGRILQYGRPGDGADLADLLREQAPPEVEEVS